MSPVGPNGMGGAGAGGMGPSGMTGGPGSVGSVGSAGAGAGGSMVGPGSVGPVGTPGGMSPSAAPSPVSQIGGLGSPHPPGMAMKPEAQPPPNVMQALKQVCHEKTAKRQLETMLIPCPTQVQEEAARQQAPHASFGKVNPGGSQMPPPVMQRAMGAGGHMGGVGGVAGVAGMGVPNQQQPGVVGGVPMGAGGPVVGAGGQNVMSQMDQWGNPRYPNAGGQQNPSGMRPNLPGMMQSQQQPQQPNPMQGVSVTLPGNYVV